MEPFLSRLIVVTLGSVTYYRLIVVTLGSVTYYRLTVVTLGSVTYYRLTVVTLGSVTYYIPLRCFRPCLDGMGEVNLLLSGIQDLRSGRTSGVAPSSYSSLR